MADDSALLVRVFTHPACGGCGVAVKAAWELHEHHGEVALRTVSLDSKEGLDEAHAAAITTIPTTILNRGAHEVARWVGAITPAALEAAFMEATR